LNKRVAAVILNYNGKHWLEKFLPSVMASTYSNLEIVVADNYSSDDSIAFLSKNYPSITIIQNESNGGFSKGYNDSLKHVIADYYILLNSDIEVTPNWIEPVIKLMESDEKIAACQPKIKMYDDKKLFEYAGASGGYMDSMGYMFCRGRIFETLEEDIKQYNNPTEVFWATGACLFVKAEIYHLFGGLYEPLFAHMEEIDFCWRLKNNGYKIYVCPESEIYHVGGGTLNKSNHHKTYLNFRNNLIIMWRNMGSLERLIKIPMRLCLDLVSIIILVKDKRKDDAWAVSKAHRQFFKHIFKWQKEKPKNGNNQNKFGIYKGSIIFQYFIKNKKKFSELNWL
jgi:GT2 family glycosyltransferase